MRPLSINVEEIHTDKLSSPDSWSSETLHASPVSVDLLPRGSWFQQKENSSIELASASKTVERKQSTTPPTQAQTSPLPHFLNRSRLSIVSVKESKDSKPRNLPLAEPPAGNTSRDDLASSIPIRRKSLRQPGIATRVVRQEEPIPSVPLEPAVKHDSDVDPLSQFLRQPPNIDSDPSSWKLGNISMPRTAESPLKRAVTPSDLGYLGGFRPGSLHVTNGRASPTPSDLSRTSRMRSAPDLRAASNESATVEGGQDNANGRIDSHEDYLPSAALSTLPVLSMPLSYSSKHIAAQIITPKSSRNPLVQSQMPNAPQRGLQAETGALAHPYKANGNKLLEVESEPRLTISHDARAQQDMTSPPLLVAQFQNVSKADQPADDTSISVSTLDGAESSTPSTCCSSHEMAPPKDKREDASTVSGQASMVATTTGSLSISSSGSQSSDSMHRDASSSNLPAQGARHNPYHGPLAAAPAALRKDQDPRAPPRPPSFYGLRFPAIRTKSLPRIPVMPKSSSTVSAVTGNSSSPLLSKHKKLNKPRKSIQSKHPQPILISGNHASHDVPIPPIPEAFSAKLALRSQQVPELECTYQTQHYAAGAEGDASSILEPIEIRFPSPPPPEENVADCSPRSRGWTVRPHSSLIRRNRAEKSLSASDIGESPREIDILDAVPGVRGSVQVFGSSPCDTVQPTDKSPLHRRGFRRSMEPHAISNTSARSTSAKTATQLERNCSRTTREREKSLALLQKRQSFDERSVLLGKTLRSASLDVRAPPVPPLPTSLTSQTRESTAQSTTNLHPPGDVIQPAVERSTVRQAPRVQHRPNAPQKPRQQRQAAVVPSLVYREHASRPGTTLECADKVSKRRSWRPNDDIDLDIQRTWTLAQQWAER